MTITTLPCGCRTCGCACPDHSPTGREDLCDRHAIHAITRFVAGEVATLGALILFTGMVGIWASVLGQ